MRTSNQKNSHFIFRAISKIAVVAVFLLLFSANAMAAYTTIAFKASQWSNGWCASNTNTTPAVTSPFPYYFIALATNLCASDASGWGYLTYTSGGAVQTNTGYKIATLDSANRFDINGFDVNNQTGGAYSITVTSYSDTGATTVIQTETFSVPAGASTVTLNGSHLSAVVTTITNATTTLLSFKNFQLQSNTLSAPTATTNAASSITSTGATLNGTVSSNGASTTVTFDYGLTTGYGSTATATQSPLATSATNTAVSVAVTGLTAGTTYHFRVKGVNSAGTTNGSDITFTTSSTVTTTATNGTITSTNNPTVSYGSTTTVTGAATTGYYFSSVSGCNGTTQNNTNQTTTTFSYTTGAITADCTVAATFAIKTYTVTTTATNGAITSTNNPTVNYGSTTTVTGSATTGYYFTGVSGCSGTPQSNTNQSTTTFSYTTGAITSACTVTSTFAIKTYTLTAQATGNGTGTVASNTGGISYTYQTASTGITSALNYGTSVTLTATAGTGSTVSWTTCTGTTGGTTAAATCTFSSLDGNKTAQATFTLNTYTVTPSAGSNGTISPSSAQTISSGSTTTFTVTPSAGYSASVGGTCGGTLSGTTYTTSAITAACTVIASFTAIPAPLPNCTYSLSNSTQTFSASGGSSSAGVNQNETNCINAGWTAAGSASWITLTSGSSGTASGTLNYSVSQNTTTASRSGSITITGHSNTAAITITQNALFTLSPSALNYGTVKTGESAVRSATVTNISGGSLTLSSVNITGADSGDFTLTNNCATLSTNGSCTLAVKFMPATAGSKTATLTVTANNVSFTTALTGTADNNATSLISVTPSEINSILESEFGNHWIISISNSGIASLLIQDIRLYGRSLNEYTVAGNCSVVLPQETCAITLATAYTSNEAKEASLVITSNASNAGRVEIPIRDTSLCSPRSIAITPASATATAGGATGGITVIAPDNCFWTTSSNVAWVNLAANNGWASGNGTVNYTVSANTGNVSRIGTIEVAGIPHKVIQNGAGPTNGPLDISGHEFENNINAMYSAGIAAGDNFNPDNIATRGDIAAFIIKAIYGEDFSYTATPYFSDVPVDHPSFKYVQKLKDDGITQVEGIYGINDSLSRGQAAALIIRAIYRESFSYPATPYFSDVPVDHGFFRYIQKMKEREFTHVPTGGEYHPVQLIPRDELAAFITEAFLGMGH